MPDLVRRAFGAATPRWLIAVFLLTSAQNCQGPAGGIPFYSSPATPVAASVPALLQEAGQCGRGLGIAVRCNLVSGSADFAVLRYATLNGLQARSGAAFEQVRSTLDQSTLDTMAEIGSCAASRTELAILEQQVEATLSRCSGTP